MGIEDNNPQQYNPYGQPQQPYGAPQQYQVPPQQAPPQQYGYEPQYTYQQQPPQPGYYNQPQPQYGMPLPPQQQAAPQYGKSTDRESLIGSGSGIGGQPPTQDPTLIGSYRDDEPKFTAPKYQDIWFSILFACNFVLLLVVSISAFSKTSYYYNDSTNSYENTSGSAFGFVFALLPVSIVFSLLYVWAWMKLASTHAEGLIKYTFIAAILLMIGYCIYFFVVGLIYLGIIFIILSLFIVLFYVSARSRIAFTATLLTNAVEIIKEFPSAVRASYLSALINFVWFIIWGSAFIRVNMVYSGSIQTCINIYMIFTLYWVYHVIKNTLHSTISGLFATWYFCSGPNGIGMPQNPTLGAARRALTTSFGSICFGSLIISVIETLRYLSQMMMGNKNVFVKIIGYIINFILSMMAAIIQFFNTYCFTMVSIYGESFCDSAKRTMQLFEQRLGATIVNDNFIGTCIYISSLVAALLLSILGALISIPFGMSVYGGVLTCFIGYLVICTSLEVVYSGVISLFVCYVMEPATLAQTKPQLYQLYNSTYKLR